MADQSKTASTIALAFLGDSIYELFVRERLMKSGTAASSRADRLHKAAVRYVCAAAQAEALREVSSLLSEEETALVKRARNHKISTKPRNTDAVTDKQATAFEALLGWLWLRGEKDRAFFLMEKAALFIEQENEG
jgi:ribonuclease-3 family protein